MIDPEDIKFAVAMSDKQQAGEKLTPEERQKLQDLIKKYEGRF